MKAISIPAAVFTCTHNEQLVYLALAFIGGKAESLSEICRAVGLSRLTVTVAVAMLVERKLITAEQQPTRHGQQWKIAIIERAKS